MHPSQIGIFAATPTKHPRRTRLDDQRTHRGMIKKMTTLERLVRDNPETPIAHLGQRVSQLVDICVRVPLVIGHPCAAIDALEASRPGQGIGIDEDVWVYFGHSMVRYQEQANLCAGPHIQPLDRLP